VSRPHALRRWPVLAPRLQRAARLLVLTDLDGTLIPIRATPDLATVDATTRAVLRRLARAPGVRLGIISGRQLADVRRMVRVPGLVYVGNHGLEQGLPGRTIVVPAARRTTGTMAHLSRELARTVRPIRGAFVEPKRYTLSVHWRGVSPRDARRFHRAVQAVLRPWRVRGTIRVTLGKRVIEVRPPVRWDKGSAVEWLARHWRCRRGELVYLGDDRTDEDAFRAVNRRGGLTAPRRRAGGWTGRAKRSAC
jgi:trehalose-phosphatase